MRKTLQNLSAELLTDEEQKRTYAGDQTEFLYPGN
jgi:hypothetical protein